MKKHIFNKELVSFIKFLAINIAPAILLVGGMALDDIIAPKTVVEEEVSVVVEECTHEISWVTSYWGNGSYTRIPITTGNYTITFSRNGESNTVIRDQSHEKGDIITVTEVKTFGNETLLKTEYR